MRFVFKLSKTKLLDDVKFEKQLKNVCKLLSDKYKVKTAKIDIRFENFKDDVLKDLFTLIIIL